MFWFWHCLFNALPSYFIASKWMNLWEKPHAQLAMFCAVVVFILGYASVTSFFRVLSDRKTIFFPVAEGGACDAYRGLIFDPGNGDG